MRRRKRKLLTPTMLLWSRAEQRQFVQTVEQLAGLVAELHGQVQIMHAELLLQQAVTHTLLNPEPKQKGRKKPPPGNGAAPQTPEG